MKLIMKQFVGWFWITGCIGVLVAIALYILGAFHYTRYFAVQIASVFCPEMILGLAEPSSPGAVLLLLAWVFATNFVLYGALGLLLCAAWSWGGPVLKSLRS